VPGWESSALDHLGEALATTWGSRVLLPEPRTQQLRDILASGSAGATDRVRALRLTQSLNTFSVLINRTRRRDIGAFATRKPETVEVDFTPEQAAVYNDLLDLTARIRSATGGGAPIEFALSTLKRQAASCLNGLAPFVADMLQRRLSDEELSEADGEPDSATASDLEAFAGEIRYVADQALALTADPKLDALQNVVHEKASLPNNKLLLFSTFRHTLRYLDKNLSAAGVRVGLVHGGVPDDERRDLRARFAKDRADPAALDVLLSSEVGTEGLDYQFCDALVNYDIPWNPMRIEQRIGRIDRRGQRSETIAIKNMVVSGTVDAVIYDRCLSRIGVFQRALGGSEAILGEITREIRAIGEDLTLGEAERAERLRQLADNKIARIQEQEELEEREAALFGLPLRKLDEEGVEQASSPWLANAQLARLVKSYLRTLGYDRAEGLFERPLSVFRPSRDLRKALLDDLREVSPNSTSSWSRWLGGAGDSTRRLTFDPSQAAETDIELLSPVHDLVRAAAANQQGFAPDTTFALRVESETLPAGTYPVAVHGWTHLGVREDFEVFVVADDDTAAEAIAKLLTEAADGTGTITPGDASRLDERHYDLWTVARATHVDETRAQVESQLTSLQTTHLARVQLLEDQLLSATHDNIRRMRESEIRSAEDDFASRTRDLQRTIERSDLTSTLLCSGVVEVAHAG
jgi:ATP-dependent helicase HepA